MSTTSFSNTSSSRWQFRHRHGFWVVAAAFLIVMAYSTVPTPLYALYQARDEFPTYMITVIFAAYAFGVSAGLYFVGHVSDWVGRKTMVSVSIALQLISAALFLLWPDVPGLILARLINGIGVGTLTASATAYLTDLRAISHPKGSGGTAGAVASFVTMSGFAIGPFIAGLLAQYIAFPLTVVFVVFFGALVLAGISIGFVPETVDTRENSRRYSPQRARLPKSSRTLFVAAASGAFVAFAVFGTLMALSPSILAQVMQNHSRLAAGAIPLTVFGSAAIALLVFASIRHRLQLILALSLSSLGIIALATSILWAHLPTFVAAAVIVGTGIGVLFRTSVTSAAAMLHPAERGEGLALFFLIAYAGLALPVLVIGVALVFLPLTPALVTFSVVALVLVAMSTTSLIRA